MGSTCGRAGTSSKNGKKLKLKILIPDGTKYIFVKLNNVTSPDQVHAILNLVGWGTFFPAGVIIERYFKYPLSLKIIGIMIFISAAKL